jgi:hypothetical protein
VSDLHASAFRTLAHIIVLMITYVWARRYLKKKDRVFSIWTIPFIINFVYLVYLVGFYQPKLLDNLGINKGVFDITTVVMTAGVIIHHLAIILHKKKPHSKLIDLAHFQVSHLIIFVPFTINSSTVSVVLLKNLNGMADFYVAATFALSTTYASAFLYKAGFKRKSLPFLRD